MKISELAEILRRQDQNAQVRLEFFNAEGGVNYVNATNAEMVYSRNYNGYELVIR